jgi:hypothetical protein
LTLLSKMSAMYTAEDWIPLEILGCLFGWAALQIGLLDPEDKDSTLLRTGETAHQKTKRHISKHLPHWYLRALSSSAERFDSAVDYTSKPTIEVLNLLSCLKTQAFNSLLLYALSGVNLYLRQTWINSWNLVACVHDISFNTQKLHVVRTRCVFVFRMDLRPKSDYSLKQTSTDWFLHPRWNVYFAVRSWSLNRDQDNFIL